MDRMKRRIATAVTMLVLCGLLVLGATFGWRALVAPLPGVDLGSSEPTTPSCTPITVDKGGRIRATQVQVSVFNGGTRDGLAERTLNALSNRGFQMGKIGNAPLDANVRRVEVWSTDRNDAEAELVALQFGRHVKVRRAAEDLGPGVDVIVGNSLRRLSRVHKSLRVSQPEDLCVPAPVATSTAATSTAAS